jgi:ribulose-bisphosphate carboxylase large chain
MPTAVKLSGERFLVLYRLTGDEETGRAKAADTCLEQTVELAGDLVPAGDIREHVVGRVESFDRLDRDHFQAAISFAVETVGSDLLQLVNVIFGNVSIKPGIRVERIEFPDQWLEIFQGPRFGRKGWRDLLGVSTRPLLCTPLKPMGLSAEELAYLAYQFALGGIDIVKDDHGLADQVFAPFRERVPRCAEAIARANRETGGRCIYMPNITAPDDQLLDNARFAKQQGVGGLLVAPGLTGLDKMRRLADDSRIGLPIMSHPSFLGSFVTSPDSGISHYALLGQIVRLAGADASIFPNYGGRFSFSLDECRRIAEGTCTRMGHIKPSLPTPGGGMSLAHIPEMLEIYGGEVILLIGGDLYRHGSDLVASCRHFRRMVERGSHDG